MIPRRRTCVETSPLEMDFTGQRKSNSNNNNNSSYSTFSNNSNNSNSQANYNDSSSNNNMPYWLTLISAILSAQFGMAAQPRTRWTVLALATGIFLFILYSGVSNDSSSDSSSSMTISDEPFMPGEDWYHNHYIAPNEQQTQKANHRHDKTRNLLIVQLSNDSQTKAWSDITSKPNRAYARQWSVDYLLHYNDSCQAQLLWDIYQRTNNDNAKPLYDNVLFLSSDAVITDLDYNLLGLEPTTIDGTLLTITSNDEKQLSLWNLRHGQFQQFARLWLEVSTVGGGGTCDDGTSVLEVVEEYFMTNTASNKDDHLVRTISPSAAGFVEPRLIKFLLHDSKNSMASLQTTVDSVCYRYYPRCDVL